MTFNNPDLYDAVLAGINGCQTRWLINTNPASYSAFKDASKAVATEVDSLIAQIAGGATVSEINLLQSIVQSVFEGRLVTSITASDYSAIASSIVALFAEMTPELQNVIPALGYITPQLFGVQVNATTDQLAGLMAMNAFMAANQPACGWNLVFPPGTYRYSRPYWLRNITRLNVSAYGACFYNSAAEDSPSATDADNYTIQTNPGTFLIFASPTTQAGAVGTFGYKFTSTAAGSSAVTCSVVGDAANFAPGDKVLLYGFTRQSLSFPPNARRFEVKTVLTANPATGVITFTGVTQFDYLDNWWDFATGKGACRIQNLTRSDFKYGEELVWNGGTLLENPNWAAPFGILQQGFFALDGYERTVVSNLKAIAGFTTECQQVDYYKSVLGYHVIDKVIDQCRFNDCEALKIAEGTGVNDFQYNGGSINGSIDISAPNQTWENVNFIAGDSPSRIVNMGNGFYVQRAVFKHCRFNPYTLNPNTTPNTGWVIPGATYTLTVAAVPTNYKITIAVANDTAAETVLGVLDVGFVIRSTTDPNRWIIVKQIYKDDATHLAIEGDFSFVPGVGEVYQWGSVKEVFIDESSQEWGRQSIIKPLAYQDANHQNVVRWGKLQRMIFSFEDLQLLASGAAGANLQIKCYSMIKEIWVNVIRAYSGASITCTLLLQDLDAVAILQNIDLLTVGQRKIDIFAVQGAAGAVALAVTVATFYRQLGLGVFGPGGFYPAYTDRTQLPQFVLELVLANDG